MFDYLDTLEWPDCEYCKSPREESKYHAGSCVHCGAKLPSFLRRVPWMDGETLVTNNATTTTKYVGNF